MIQLYPFEYTYPFLNSEETIVNLICATPLHIIQKDYIRYILLFETI